MIELDQQGLPNIACTEFIVCPPRDIRPQQVGAGYDAPSHLRSPLTPARVTSTHTGSLSSGGTSPTPCGRPEYSVASPFSNQ